METILHPIVLVAMIIVVLVILFLPRKYTLIAFLFGTFLIPSGQEILVSGVHIFVFRIIVLAGLVRMFLLCKHSSQTAVFGGGWNPIDTAFSLSVVFHVAAFSILYMNAAAFVNQGGFAWDHLGGYFLLRCAIQDEEDGVQAIKCFVVLAVIMAICMIREQFTGQNLFGLLGGVRLVSEVRGAHVRSEAVFQHAILAGTFGATLLPLFALLWKSTKSKLLAIVGLSSSTIMTLTAFSSTPALGYIAGIGAIFLWPLRSQMRLIRWGMVFGVIALSAIMKAPVWFLIAHVGVLTGSSTYHRADLVDTFIRHFNDWWLLGTDSNNSWGFFMFDTSNQYVEKGVTGGLLSLIFFVLTISRSFGRIGAARKAVEGRDRRNEWLLWLLGSAVLANTVAFFGISYFDQTKVSWFALLAIAAAVTTPLLKANVVAKDPEIIAVAGQSPLKFGHSLQVGNELNRSSFSGGMSLKSQRPGCATQVGTLVSKNKEYRPG